MRALVLSGLLLFPSLSWAGPPATGKADATATLICVAPGLQPFCGVAREEVADASSPFASYLELLHWIAHGIQSVEGAPATAPAATAHAARTAM